MNPLLAVDETTNAVPYPWVLAIVSVLCTVICFLAKIIVDFIKREQERSDKLAGLVNRFLPVPECDCKEGQQCAICSR